MGGESVEAAGARRRVGQGTGPGHAEKEALQREAKEEAVAGQAGAEARSVRERGEGAGLGFPAPLEGGVCPPHPCGVWEWVVATRRRSGFSHPSLPGRGGKGWGIGGGESLQLERGAIPAGPWRRNDSPHAHPVGSWAGCWEDRASKEVGWCEGRPHRPGRGVLPPFRAVQYWRHHLLPAGLQDGLRSSSNSRSGSRERREEQTDTSDGESVTHHIRRLNQQPSQGLGPRGYDPNR